MVGKEDTSRLIMDTVRQKTTVRFTVLLNLEVSSRFLKLVDMDSGVPKEFADSTSMAHGLVLSCPASENGEVSNELRGRLSVAFTLGATQLVIIITEMRTVSVSDKFRVLFTR
jgi:hypothetical protein